jgi:hypothetical protein
MFLTTIIMVAVLVVALSTSTFAWYTAQNNVAATNTTLYAASSSAASLGLDTANNGANSTNSSVSLTLTTDVVPMVPTALFSTETTKYSTVAFTTAPVDNANKFTAAGSPISPAKIASADVGSGAAAQDYFYIVNTNGTNAASVTVAVNIITDGYTLLKSAPANFTTAFGQYYTRTGTGTTEDPYVFTALTEAKNWATDTYYVSNSTISGKLRVSVFSDDSYIGVWGDGNIYYGEIANGAAGTTSLTAMTGSSSGAALSLGSIDALDGRKIQVCAWFEGTDLVVANSALASVFTIAFAIA